jgi:hypothetical protein
MKRIAGAALVAMIATSGPAAALGPVSFGPDMAALGWENLTFRGRAPASFTPAGPDALSIAADGGVSVLWRALPRDFADATTARWRWKVDRGVPATDLARKGADDRDIAVYFLFADDPATLDSPPTSLTGAMRKGRALVYVWGGNAAPGTAIESPHMRGRGQLVVKRPAGPGGWENVSVTLRSDFRQVFGREPGPLVGLGVSTDSDDTGTATRATLGDLVID